MEEENILRFHTAELSAAYHVHQRLLPGRFEDPHRKADMFRWKEIFKRSWSAAFPMTSM